jgi:hypothetical protein
VKLKRSEVKLSEVVYILGRGSSDYVAMSYRLDGAGSFLGSMLVFSVFFVFSVLSVSCVL